MFSLLFTGRGVWEDWQYRIELTNVNNNEVVSAEGEATDAMQVTGLDPNVEYSVRARAFSIGGDGPWSNVFNGTTLQTGMWNCSFVCFVLFFCGGGGEPTKTIIIDMDNQRCTLICFLMLVSN